MRKNMIKLLKYLRKIGFRYLLVQSAIEQLTVGRTSFVIANRLSTIKNSDIIFVMKDGDIIESGSHQELLYKNGFYTELYKNQFEIA